MAKKIKIKQIEDGLAKVDGSNIPPATQWPNLHAGGLDDYLFHGSDVGSTFESVLVIDQGAIFRTNRGGFRTWVGIGTMSDLTTTHKTTIVGAINEVNSKTTDIKIGSRNYVLGSDKYLTDPSQGAIYFNASELQNWRGKTVTVSADIELINATGSRIGFEPAIYFQNGNIMYIGAWYSISQGANFKGRISTTYEIPDLPISHLAYNGIYIQCNGTTTTIGRPKLEFGNKATDWTPAIEDYVSDYTETDSTKLSFIKNKPDFHKILGLLAGDTNNIEENSTMRLYYNGLANSPWSSQDIIGTITNFGGKHQGYDLAMFPLAGGAVFFRQYINGSVDVWKEFITSHNFNPANKANVNGNNTIGGSWAIDMAISPVLGGAIGNSQVYNANANGFIYWGNPYILRHTFEMATDDGLKVYSSQSGSIGDVWHQFNFDPTSKANTSGHYPNLSAGKWNTITFNDVYSSTGSYFLVSNGGGIYNYTDVSGMQVILGITGKVSNLDNVTGIGFANGSFSGLPYFYHPTGGYKFLATIEYINNQDYASVTYVNNSINNAVANIPVHNGQLTVNTTADLVGGYVYLPSGNVTTTLGLATHVLNAIADGQTAYSYGNHATQGYLKAAALNGYATQAWVTAQIASVGTPGNGSVILQGVGSLTGTATFSMNQTNNVVGSFDLTPQTKAEIQAGVEGNNRFNEFFADLGKYLEVYVLPSGGNVPTTKAFFSLVNPINGGNVIDIEDHYVHGARLVLQNATNGGGYINYTGNFIMKNLSVSSGFSQEGTSEYTWDTQVGKWRQVF